MRKSLSVLAASLVCMALASCARTTTRSEFLAQLTPAHQTIHKYWAALHESYIARVTESGPVAVNRAVNRAHYVRDVLDEWHPSLLWTKGGDCEDFALAKMLELKAQGWPESYLSVLTAKDNSKNHAVLLVELDGAIYALDNEHRDPIAFARLLQAYRLRYVINTNTGQVYVPRPGRDRPAANPV